jgi:hypothetical protein
MTSEELAKSIGCSKPWVFYLKKKFPDRCPSSFDDVPGWKAVLDFSRTQAKVKYTRGATQPRRDNGQKTGELSDIARLTKARANKVETEHEILTIELAATKRQVIRQEEAIALFARIATIVRGRLMKMRNDLPNILLGLNSEGIDRVLAEKMEEALSSLVIPGDFWVPKGLV